VENYLYHTEYTTA